MKNLLAGLAALGTSALFSGATRRRPIDLGVNASDSSSSVPQRWVLFWDRSSSFKPDEPHLGVEQFADDEWSITPGQWFLGSLAGWDKYSPRAVGDRISIDLGAKWYASGAKKAVDAAMRALGPESVSHYRSQW